ncbi:MAG: histidinol dehydrogenase, partial [Candidatus Poribacteria bacterium]|nr:histidinol dehydrogenase [Candidatus Poribacteria bacterium]
MIRILDAHSEEAKAFIEKLNRRGQLEDTSILRTVHRILQDVRKNGDKAVIKYTRRFDAPRLSVKELRVTAKEIDDAYPRVDSKF